MTILADTSIWIDHLRSSNPHLSFLLDQGQIAIHPMVIGELACGNLPDRFNMLEHLEGLPQVSRATDVEVLFFIEQHQLMGKGIGYIDAHLLAATMFDRDARLWTRDRRLMSLAVEMGIGYLETR